MRDAFSIIPESTIIEMIVAAIIFIILWIFFRGRKKAARITRKERRKFCVPFPIYVKNYYDSKFLFIDTETTGLPKDSTLPASDDDNWPYTVQISWIVTDVKGKVIAKENHLIKPNGFVIPEEAVKVHGITTERALEEGEPLDDVLDILRKDSKRCGLVVGHNVSFDKKVIGSEYLRYYQTDPLKYMPSADTMKSSVLYCKIRKWKGGYKYPSLEQLYRKLFGHKFKDAHNSAADVEAMMQCFFKLRHKGYITFN